MHMKRPFRRILSLLLSAATILTMSGLCLAAEQDDGETPEITSSDTSSIELPSSSEDHINQDSSSSSESSTPSSSKSESEEANETLPSSSETPAELPKFPVVQEYSTDGNYVKSNVEYNIDAQENPDIWGGGTIDWPVPEEDGSLGNLTATNVYPASTLYFPLGKDMYTKLKIGTDHLVALQDLDIQWDDDYKDRPFLLDVDKTEHPELINEIRVITEKKLDGKLTRTCYLMIKLNDSDTVEDIETTGTITIKAQMNVDGNSNNHGSTYQTGDTIKFDYSLTVGNKPATNGAHVQLGDRIYMQPAPNKTNTLIWDNARAAIQFTTGDNPEKFYAYLTPRFNQQVVDHYYVEGDNFWFFNFPGRPTIPALSPATLTIGIPWSDGETHPAIANIYIYKVNDNNTLTDITTQFTYSKDGALIEGWSTTTNQLGYYMIAGRNLLYTPPSDGGHSGGHSGGGGGGGGGKGGGGGASANLVKAATVTKSATAAVTNSISNALKANLKTTAANIPITAGSEISPATVKSVVKAINATAKNKGVAITPAMTLTKTSAGKVVSSISFNPMKFTSLKNVQLGVALDDKASRTALSKLYRNNMQMVKFTQTGAFGMDVAVTAKLNLASSNTKTLLFYTYDRTKKTLTPIATPNYSIDKNGYLHFTTNMGNTVVITDSVLQKKA